MCASAAEVPLGAQARFLPGSQALLGPRRKPVFASQRLPRGATSVDPRAASPRRPESMPQSASLYRGGKLGWSEGGSAGRKHSYTGESLFLRPSGFPCGATSVDPR